MSLCPNCGNAVAEADRYCVRCGRALLPGTEGDTRSRPAGAASFLEAPASSIAAASAAYRPPRTRALVAMLAIGAVGFASMLEAGHALSEIRLLQDLGGISLFGPDEVARSQNVASAVAVFYSLAFFSAMLAFLVWMYRVSSNLRALSPERPRFSPRWAVGWYFVPLMNLVRPYQVMAELWRGSARSGSSALLGWWWGLWIAANLVSGVVQQPTLTAAVDVENAISVRIWAAGASGLLVAAAVLAILVIRGVTSRQERAAGASAPVPGTLDAVAEAASVQIRA